MTRRVPVAWIRQGSWAVLLLSLGVVLGSYVRAPAPPTPAIPTLPPALAKRVAPPATPPEPLLPPPPGEGMFFDASGFAGTYAVLRGAETVGVPPGLPPMVRTPSLAAAPEAVVEEGAPGLAAGREASRASTPRGFRPSPGQGIPRGIALRHPLLAVSRGGGRVVFYDLATGGGPNPAGLEGDWSVIGRCERSARVEFSVRPSHTGALRAIGRSADEGAWAAEPVVARQACGAATGRFTRPHAPSDLERAALGPAGDAAGLHGADLQQLIELRSSTLLVFHAAESRSVVMVGRTGQRTPSWTVLTSRPDGDLWLIGVYRSGAGAVAWFAVGDRTTPNALLLASTSDLRTWTVADPVPLVER